MTRLSDTTILNVLEYYIRKRIAKMQEQQEVVALEELKFIQQTIEKDRRPSND